jgi:hypothetical protein
MDLNLFKIPLNNIIHLYRYLNFIFHRMVNKIYFVRTFHLLKLSQNEYVLMLPKVASRSLRDLEAIRFTGGDEGLDLPTWRRNYIASNNYRFISARRIQRFSKNNKLYIFYRPWSERISSCYRQKIKEQDGLFYFWNYFPYLYPNMSEELFVRRVVSMPEFLREKHFARFVELDKIENAEKLDKKEIDAFLVKKFGRTLRSNYT